MCIEKKSRFIFLVGLLLRFVITQNLNVLYRTRTQQSSVDLEGEPSRAVDGNVNQNWNSGSCTLTKLNYNNWWMSDMFYIRRI